MASLDSVFQKLYRAKHHCEELDQELRDYYRSDPVKFTSSEFGFDIGGQVPARMGLIAGDALQCMRSSLDYLVWELVLASGNQPDRQNAFPISLSLRNYKNEVDKQKRLQGVDPAACALIDTLQPFHLPETERERSPLAVLDNLTNINKHRRVLLTHLQRVVLETPLPFPHVLSDLTGTMPGGVKHRFVTFGFFAAFNEGSVSGEEIFTALNVFGDYIGNEVLPLFKKFFEVP
jgi:hypothetical protein